MATRRPSGSGATSDGVIQAKEWVPDSVLVALDRQGLMLREIAEYNYRKTGWRPTVATVSHKMKRLRRPARHGSRRDLLPWPIDPMHRSSRFRYMLAAESKRRRQEQLTPAEQRLVELLFDILTGRGAPMVVGYDPEIGFHLVDKSESDQDIIRVRNIAEDYENRSAIALSPCDDDAADAAPYVGVARDGAERIRVAPQHVHRSYAAQALL